MGERELELEALNVIGDSLVRLEEAGLSSDAEHRLLGHSEPLPQILSHGPEGVWNQEAIVEQRDARIGLGQNHLYEVHSTLEKGPGGIHILEDRELTGLNGLDESLADTQPDWKVETSLGPCKDPRDGSECLHASSLASLCRAAANVEASELHGALERVRGGRAVRMR